MKAAFSTATSPQANSMHRCFQLFFTSECRGAEAQIADKGRGRCSRSGDTPSPACEQDNVTRAIWGRLTPQPDKALRVGEIGRDSIQRSARSPTDSAT